MALNPIVVHPEPAYVPVTTSAAPAAPSWSGRLAGASQAWRDQYQRNQGFYAGNVGKPGGPNGPGPDLGNPNWTPRADGTCLDAYRGFEWWLNGGPGDKYGRTLDAYTRWLRSNPASDCPCGPPGFQSPCPLSQAQKDYITSTPVVGYDPLAVPALIVAGGVVAAATAGAAGAALPGILGAVGLGTKIGGTLGGLADAGTVSTMQADARNAATFGKASVQQIQQVATQQQQHAPSGAQAATSAVGIPPLLLVGAALLAWAVLS